MNNIKKENLNKSIHYTAGGILKNKDNQIFLIFNKNRRTFQLPKGHLEKGETSKMAAIREVREETGYRNIKIISQKSFKIFFTFKDRFDNNLINQKHTIYYIMKLVDEERIHTKEQDDEKLGGDWFYIDDAIKKASFKNIKNILIEMKNLSI